jgi:hypothetical protein
MNERTIFKIVLAVAGVLLVANALAWGFIFWRAAANVPAPRPQPRSTRPAPPTATLRPAAPTATPSPAKPTPTATAGKTLPTLPATPGAPFRVTMSNQQLTEAVKLYLAQHPEVPFSDPQVQVHPDGVEITGKARVGGLSVPVRVWGLITLVDNVPYFEVTNVDLGQAPLPGSIKNIITALLDQSVDFSQFNLPMVVQDIQLGEGQVTITGTAK